MYMYSRYNYLLFVYFFILTSLLYYCFHTCFCSFFIVLSIVYQCHVITRWEVSKFLATPLINLRSYAYNSI